MSSLRHDRDSAQDSETIRQIAHALEPYPLSNLLLIGMPAWCGLPFLWQPSNELQERAVEQLVAQRLVQPAPQTDRSVILTPLGSQVAAVSLASMLPLKGVR